MIISLLTDYGTQDAFVGVCHGVILKIDPQARIIDLTHNVPAYDVRHGAVVLRDALPYLPVGVHVAIVDPAVGTDRRAVALRCADGRVLVGPDNGVLCLAWEACGGVVEAVEVSDSPFRLEPVSPTFHGRDLFVPVAARIAAGAELSGAGRPLDARGMVRIDLPEARVEGATLIAQPLFVDTFGNLRLNAGLADLALTGARPGDAVIVETGGRRHAAMVATTFADAPTGEMIVYRNPDGALAVAVREGEAAHVLNGTGGPIGELRISAA